MDLKSLYILISAVAVGLGVVAGWRDARQRRSHVPGPDTEAGAASGSGPVPPPAWEPPRPGGRHHESLWDSEGLAPLAEAAEPATAGASGPEPPEWQGSASRLEPPAGGESAAASRLESVSPGADGALFREVETLLAAGDFQGAAGKARELALGNGGTAREEAWRLEARAHAFEQLVPPEAVRGGARTAAARTTEPTARGRKVVHLASGAAVEAERVLEEPERYVIVFPGGERRVVWREDVLAVGEAAAGGAGEAGTEPGPSERAAGPAAAEEWARIAPRVEALDHPVDLYVRGVRKCFELGLLGEGLRLLEKVLLMEESDSIPFLFADQDSRRVYVWWEVAAGRLPVRGPDLGSFVDEQVALMEREALALARRPDEETGTPAPDGGALEDKLEEAKRLVAEGRDLYRGALGRDGAGPEIHRAHDKLRQAQEILAALPRTEEVRELNRTLGQLLQDVAKTMPLF